MSLSSSTTQSQPLAPSPSSSPSQHGLVRDGAAQRNTVTTYLITALVILFTVLFFFRSILPRIIRAASRHFSVRRIGPRGIRDLQWSSPTSSTVVRVKRIYATFGKSKERAQRSWLTINVQGVDVRVPHNPDAEAAEEQKKAKARAQRDKEEEEERQEREQEEQRLEALVQGSSAGLSRGTTPRSVSATTPADIEQDGKASNAAQAATRFLLDSAYPRTRDAIVQAARGVLFVLASALPALVSIIEIQVHAVEVHLEEADAVLSIQRAGIEFSMELVSMRVTDNEGIKETECVPTSEGLYRRCREMVSAVSNRISSSARDTASLMTAGLPAGRASARLRLSDLRLREAKNSSSENVLDLPSESQLHVGLLLGPSLRLRGKEAVEVHLKTSDIKVGVDALYRVVRVIEERKAMRMGPMPTADGLEDGDRSGLSKHFVSQRKQPAAKALMALRAASLTIPRIRIAASPNPIDCDYARSIDEEQRQRLPRHIEVEAIVEGIGLSVSTSSPRDAAHRRWLGSCGILNHKSLRGETQLTRKAKLTEYRRAFKLDFAIKSVQASCRLNDDQHRSELLHLGQLKVQSRSTWTPFGVLPSAMCDGEGPPRYFAGDPNEESVVAEVSLAQVRGDVKLNALTGLVAFAEMRQEERREIRKKLSLDKPPKKNKVQLLDHVPKLSCSFEVKDVCYRVDAGHDVAIRPTKMQPRHSSLIFKLPSLAYVAHGNYKESFVKRSELERRAAWKALANDELEWSIMSDYKSQGPGMTSPKLPSAGFASFVGRVKDQFSPGRARNADDSASSASSPPMTRPSSPASRREEPQSGMSIEEAVRQMKELQKREDEQQKNERDDDGIQEVEVPATTASGQKTTRLIRVPPHLTRKASTASKDDSTATYAFESHFSCPSVESFFVLARSEGGDEGEGGGAGESERDDEGKEPSASGLTRLQLLTVTNSELGLSGTLPGKEDLASNRVSLQLRKHQTQIKAIVEEIDVEVWHPKAFAFAQTVIDGLQAARRPFKDESDESSEEKSEEAEEEKEAEESKAVIDRIPTGADIWISIGGILAHIGGSDVKCDPHLTRGVGFEARRIVAELACQSRDAAFSNTRPDWGHRSALLLPEDVKTSASSLASRHGKSAVGKLSLYEIGVFPLLDVEQAVQLVGPDGHALAHEPTSKQTDDADAPSVFADAIWDFQERQPAFRASARRRYHQEDRSQNFIFWMPYSGTKITVRPPGAHAEKVGKRLDEVTIIGEGTRLLAFKIQLLHTYCVLIAVAALRDLSPRHRSPVVNPPESKPVNQPSKKQVHRHEPTVFVDFGISDVHLYVDLPEQVRLFVHLRRLDVRKTQLNGLSVSFESLMGAVESPRMLATELWEEAARLRDWTVTVQPGGGPEGKLKVTVNGDGATMRIPFGYVVHNIIDSASVAFKATKQLVHQFVKGAEDSAITPVGEDPKHLPFIDLNIRIMTIEAQDDPIETRLNIIWRAGGDENRARLDREEAFEAKVNSLTGVGSGANGASQSTISLDSSRSSSIWENSESEDEGDGEPRSEASSNRGGASSRQESSRVSSQLISEARERLDVYNSTSWIRRHANAKAEQGRREDAVLKKIFGRYPSLRQAVELPIKMAQPTRAAPLFRSSMMQIAISVGPTSFSEDKLRDWLHEQGNGTPKDLPYSLLVPFHMRWRMSEWRFELRDYPIPLLHIPPTRSDQPSTMPAFELSGDMCIAEHLSEGSQSIRHVPAVVVPAATGRADAKEYGINVPKVAMPVKFYGSPVIDVNSSYPTRFAWGQSLQPAIQDMVRVFDGISSPPHDPSPKPGFWDKLPLVLQSKLLLRWSQDGEIHFYLKGSRDPYSIVGNGAGWVMCWRKNVQVRLGFDNEDKEFMQFLSNEFILAIPDLRDYQDSAATGLTSGEGSEEEPEKKEPKRKPKASVSSSSTDDDANKARSTLDFGHQRYKKEPHFSKICLRLTHGVRWGASLRHEHTCRNGNCPRDPPCRGDLFHRECRFFDRRPHWSVIQRSKEYMDTLPEEERTDSFYGWRSDFTHLGISIYSPEHGFEAYGEKWGQQRGVNNLYFSPLAWQHFWAWLRLFDSAMGLPIRHGRLFPGTGPQSPKFGRQLGTIKYRFDIAPLFITHLYPQFSRADWARGAKTMLGIKARLAVFHVDMHQRQQEMVKERPETNEKKTGYHKPFYEAEADFGEIDLRALLGRFTDVSKKLVPHDEIDAEDEFAELFEDDAQDRKPVGVESEWLDMHDFIEVDALPPGEDNPKIRLIPTLTCPRFNFYRRYDSRRESKAKAEAKGSSTLDEKDADNLERTKFGNECPQTHTCLIGKAPWPSQVQKHLATGRIEQLQRELEESKAKSTRDDLFTRIKLIGDYMEMLNKLEKQEEAIKGGPPGANADGQQGEGPSADSCGDGSMDIPELYHDWETFDDRFFIHNPTLFFTNETRFILLRYYVSSKRRKGFIHNMTARAIWNIRQLSEALEKQPDHRPGPQRQNTTASKAGSELLTGLLNDTMQYVVSDIDERKGKDAKQNALLDTRVDPQEGISDAFKVRRANVCVLLKPQIVMKSRVDNRSSIIVTAIRTRLQNYAILDPTVTDEDSVNRRVLSRNYFSLDGLQAFYPSDEQSLAQSRTQLVYVPLETLVDLKLQTKDFDRIVSRTDASLRYDKFNRLRLNDSTRPLAADLDSADPAVDHLRHHMDLLRVRCPRFAVSANSTHFGAMYNIVTDLVLYRAPSWREHAKQLEAMQLSYDFKDTGLLADVVASLQMRIRQALELDAQYQLRFDELNERGRHDLFDLKGHLSELVEELLLITEAITASEDAKADDEKDKKSALRMEAHANDLSWNMMGEEDGELLAKLSIKGPSFTWLNKADNSAANSLSIVDLHAVNVHPDAYFPEIITKWDKAPEHRMAKQKRFVNAIWSELAPVGGISIVDQFELDLHPVKVQLELKVGRIIMDYVFGSKRRREREEQKRKDELEEGSKQRTVSKSKRSPLAMLRGSEGKSSDTSSNNSSGHASPRKSYDVSSRGADGQATDDEERPSRRTSTSSDGTKRSASSDTRLESKASSSSLKDKDKDKEGKESKEEGDSDEDKDHSQHAIAKRNADEMRQRSSSNLTFIYFKLQETVFCLSYKSDKDKSITDIYDLVFRAPDIEYRNRTWAYEELVQHMKKDIFRAAWGQRTTILKTILSHRPKRPEALRNIREKQAWLRKTSSRDVSPSVQFNVEPPTPQRSREGTPNDTSLDKNAAAPSHAYVERGPNGGGDGGSSGDGSIEEIEPQNEDNSHHSQNRLSRFLHNHRLTGGGNNRSQSGSDASGSGTLSRASSAHHDGSSGEGTTAVAEEREENQRTVRRKRDEDNQATVRRRPDDSTVRKKGSLGFLSMQRERSHSSGSHRSVSRMRGGEDEQQEPGKDADEEQKARALLGSSRQY
ncbi:hypothetical protein BDZ90DRAFT_232818 [Jaminaea rosea]|uniref:Uncharacterized protein n=1 Tax=Jaminaea rosea TaxID=1569628 RepID=A0A316UQV6_9BASI|nr:hypothetical protein BDZ90DRAFT_232818 [Jaminaea rosea]PWN26691.1 hypothetical protein BDZ90DRAFT_232818 [Jaminaea rosea]